MDHNQQNAEQLQQLAHFVVDRKALLKQQYEKHLSADLSRQQWQGCFQRNVLAVLEAFYDDVLRQLQSLPFKIEQYPVENGMSALTRQILATFDGFIDEFLLFVVDRHRTSCALSNFPDEHKPDRDYVNEVKRDIAGLWKQFALNANAYFLERQ